MAKTLISVHSEISSLVYALGTTVKRELVEAMTAAICPKEEFSSDGDNVKIKQTATKRKRLIRATIEMRSSLDDTRAKVAADEIVIDMWSGLRRWLHVPSKSEPCTTLTHTGLISRALCVTMVSRGDQLLAIKHDSWCFTMKLTQDNATFQNQILLLGARVRAVMMYDAFRTTKKVLVPRFHHEELTVCVCARDYLHSRHVTQLPVLWSGEELNSHNDFLAGCAQLTLVQAVRNHVHLGLVRTASRLALPIVDFYCHVALIVKLAELLRRTAKCSVAHFVQGYGLGGMNLDLCSAKRS
jgi:hypothetical protein